MRDVCDLTARGSIEPGTLEKFLHPPKDPFVARVDLTDLTWVQPYGLVSLAVFVEAQGMLLRPAEVITPSRADVARYLARMGLGAIVDALGGYHELPPVRHNNMKGKLLELQAFDTEAAVEMLGELVFDKVCGTDERSATAMHQTICEIGQNVTQHSGRSAGYAAAQTTHGDTRVAFAIGDAGIGLKQSLQMFDFGNDADVLEAVMRGGVSSTNDPARGNGFKTARELITATGGVLHAQTGSATRTEHPGGRSSVRVHPAMNLRGTILQGRLDY